MKKYIVIVAGGSGRRMDSATPKQFLELHGLPILMHTVKKFHQSIAEGKIILALSLKEQSTWKYLCEKHQFDIPHQIVNGGESRFHSVQNALQKVCEKSIVSIHDGVRPLVNKTVIKNCLHFAEKFGAAIPVLPIQDSIRKVLDKGSQIEDRRQFVMVQTPQCFQSEIILKAYQQQYHISFTDDASVVEQLGQKIYLVEGNKENIKITTKEDLKIAQALS